MRPLSPRGTIRRSGEDRMGKYPALALLAAICCATTAHAQEVALRAVTAFAEKTTYSCGFEAFVERVNEAGKGIIRINYIGGPKAMPAVEGGNPRQNGAGRSGNVTGAFYTNLLPEADAWKLTQRPMAELRKNGGYDTMAALYAQKMNAILLARLVDDNPFHLYLNKRIASPDLKGLKLRITPVYRDFFQALGGTVVQTAPGEVYTALERGVVDGYGWPITGIFDLGWNERTKYRVDPGFYSAEVSILINKTVWDGLGAARRGVLGRAADQGEAGAAAAFAKDNAAETERQTRAGIEAIAFDAAASKHYLDIAYEAGWAGVIRQSPENGPKLQALFAKPR